MQNTSPSMTQAPLKNDANQQGWNEIQELLQHSQQENNFMRQQMEILRHENRILKDRIKTIDSETQASKTDSEKAILLGLEGSPGLEERMQGGAAEVVEEPSSRDSSYIIADHNGELVLPGFPSSSSDGSVVLPDEPSNVSDGNWDILSSDGEGSMANLHDRILQMEENHYTVNEELQATLQELKDLQDQVTDLTLDTDKLGEEKSMIIEALYRQMSKTERLNMFVLHLKGICDEHKLRYDLEELNDSVPSPRTAVSDQASGITRSKEEQEKLTDLLKEHNREIQSEVDKLKYQLLEMESMLRGALAARKSLEQEITVFKGKLSSLEVEREKGETLLRAEKDKLNQLFQYQDPKGILNLPQLLEDARLKRDAAESRCAELARALEESNNHCEKLQEELERIEDEYESSKNHFEEQVERYQAMIRELDAEKQELETELINLKETVIELEETVERQEYDKQQHLSTIADLNQAVQTLREEKQNIGRDLIDLKRTSARDSEEWVQFQRDLQKAVVIANDYRNEAQNEVKMLEKDKGDLRDQIKSLSAEVERLRKIERAHKPPTPTTTPAPPRNTPTENEIRQRMQAIMKSSEKDIVRGSTSRKTLSNGKVSVKNIIQNLESNAGADAPKAPVSPTDPVSMTFTTNTRPPMERRNTTIAITKSMNSKPLYTRRATTTILTTHDSQKLSMASSSRAHDDSMIGRSRSQPANRTEARQMIGDALTRSRDFSTRRSTPSSRDTSDSPTSRRAKSLCNEPISSGRRSSSTSSMRDSCDSPTPRDSVGNQSPTARKTNDGIDKKDPLSILVKSEGGGSKRNALLKWCQARTHGYKGVEVTNFSSSWNDGLAFCAIIHSYMHDMIPWNELNNQDKKRNFTVAFKAGESIEISSILDIDDMVKMERPDWKSVMTYVTALYKHFET